MVGKSEKDWSIIETEYITGNISYRELAEKYNESEGYIERLGGQGKWWDKRREYRKGLVDKAVAKAQETASFARAKFDEFATRACDAVVAAMARKATDLYNAGILDEESARKILEAVGKALEIKYRALDVPAAKQPIEISRTASPMVTLIEEINALQLNERDAEERYVPVAVEDEPDGNGTNYDGNGTDTDGGDDSPGDS